ncbi:MAG: MFS transporter [Anaerolineaceae bacterium]|jgi:EmrB/QacA subfamily drug resistance transporter
MENQEVKANLKVSAKKRIAYKWIVLSVTTVGALMAAIDSTIVVLGLPNIMESLHSDLVSMIWVIMAYILASTIFLLTFGRVADLFGRVRMYNLGFVVFTIGSALCGFSANATQLIIFRLVQGSGGAMLVVNSAALITEVFPPNERGRALGINGITWAAGGVLGPILGGLILSAGNWRWIFFINIPIGILGVGWGYLALKEMQSHSKTEKFDPLGALSFSAGLTALLLALTMGIEAGWTSVPVLILYFIFAAGLVFFLFWERRVKSPVLDFSLFKPRVYTFSVLAAMGQSLALFAVNFLIVFYLQGVRGYDPLKAALLLIPLPVMSSIMGPLSGALSDRIGARIPATVGLLISAVALVFLTGLTPTTPYLPMAFMLALLGIGGGMFFPANTSAAMNAAPRERLGVASATLATLRQAGMVTSFALSLAVAAASLPNDIMMQLFVGTNVTLGSKVAQDFVIGMRSAFVLSVVLTLVAAGFSFIRGKENRRQLASDFIPHNPEA